MFAIQIAFAALLTLTPTVSLAACNAVAEGDADSYKKAYSRVASLPELKAWPESAKAVFGAHADKQSLVGKKCYWSVTVYSNEGTQLTLWKSFLVPTGPGPILKP